MWNSDWQVFRDIFRKSFVGVIFSGNVGTTSPVPTISIVLGVTKIQTIIAGKASTIPTALAPFARVPASVKADSSAIFPNMAVPLVYTCVE
ncbi:hypothetical protein BPO_p0029 (plasmid) [Bergeyella porcorum]|uniref:Uncharacterized protein n=1 Tax=Bergeyella porcorum TaxID=1735111 RepID=A0AAU0F5U9_9FLAO